MPKEGTTLSRLLAQSMAGPKETAARKASHRGLRSNIHLEGKSTSTEAKTYAKNNLKSISNLDGETIKSARRKDQKSK